MDNKNTPPTDVTLEQTASGIWAAPASPKASFPRRFNKPWQRLWIVSGILYLLILTASYSLLIPNRESIAKQMVMSITEEVKRYDGMAFAGESPRQVFESARSQGYADWIVATRSKYRIGREGDAGFARIDKEYREALSDLPLKRTFAVLLCVVFWVVPMAVLYAIGLAVDWIKGNMRITLG